MENFEKQINQAKPATLEAVLPTKEEAVLENLNGDLTEGQNEEIYQKFAAGRKKVYASFNGDPLKEAQYDREGAIHEVESSKRSAEMAAANAEKIREEINQLKDNLITRIIEFKQIRELKKKLGTIENSQKIANEQLARRAELAGFYDKLVAEQEKMAGLIEEAYKDNKEFDAKKKAEFLEDEKNRDVKALAVKHDVFFVHDIVVAEWKPSANNRAIDTKNLDFNDQLNIIMGLEPTLAVSTLSPDSKNRTFGNGSWGVLMSGGRIIGGQETDAASVATGLRKRQIDERYRTIGAIDEAIERPWDGGKEKSESYNELVMENPEVAGAYFKWSDEDLSLKDGKDIFLRNSDKVIYDSWWNQLQETMKTGVPIFVIEQNNNVRLVHDINLKARSFRVTPRYEPENLINMPGTYQQHLGKNEKHQAVARVFDKVAGLIPEEERAQYKPDGSEGDSRGFINVH